MMGLVSLKYRKFLGSGICGLWFCSTIELISQREPSPFYTSVAAHCGGFLCSSSRNELLWQVIVHSQHFVMIPYLGLVTTSSKYQL